jgi:hypothetical protein
MPLLPVVLLSWALPASAQPSAAPPADLATAPTEPAADTAEQPAPADAADVPVTGPDVPAAPPTDDAAAPLPVPADLPGHCPAPAAQTIEDRLARSDAGDAVADLDLAACWRLLGQSYPETVALDRALTRGLDEPAAAAARRRLADLGGPPVLEPPAQDGAGSDRPEPDAPAADQDDDAALAAYVLAGLAGAGLLTGTAFGLATLHESSRAERELAGDTQELEYGIATGVCLGVGLAAGIAAIVLWPEATTGPAPGPGDVGLGWEVRW